MYKCEWCGAEFDRPAIGEVETYLYPDWRPNGDGMTTEEVPVCPECGEPEFEVLPRCALCRQDASGTGIDLDELCPACREKLKAALYAIIQGFGHTTRQGFSYVCCMLDEIDEEMNGGDGDGDGEQQQ